MSRQSQRRQEARTQIREENIYNDLQIWKTEKNRNAINQMRAHINRNTFIEKSEKQVFKWFSNFRTKKSQIDCKLLIFLTPRD